MNTQAPTNDDPLVYGTVKSFSVERAQGLILAAFSATDFPFQMADYSGSKTPLPGDIVQFRLSSESNSRSIAKAVRFVKSKQADRAISKRVVIPSPVGNPRQYFGKPTEILDSPNVGGALLGAVIGSMFGDFGAVAGAAIGLGVSTRPVELSDVCLRCEGTGHVTAITASRIGYQCANCLAFWSKANTSGITRAGVRTKGD